MAKHPGDPRSDVLGEQQYDESEYPYNVYSPPPSPPIPGNQENYIPYRGQEQHGVQITRNTDHDTGSLPYKEEQIAQDRYTDPTITPRDLSNVPPIRVQVVKSPDLLFRRKVRATNYSLNNTNPGTVGPSAPYFQIANNDPFRKRLYVSIMSSDSGTMQGFLSFDQDSPNDLGSIQFRATAQSSVIYDGPATNAVWFKPTYFSATSAVLNVLWEYEVSDGDKLL